MSSYLNLRSTRFLFLLFLVSCDRPQCNNNNPVFNDHLPTSNKYKVELADQINEIGPENLSY